MTNQRTMKTEDYIECPRCDKNNWNKPEFQGCPRGSCEVEIKGSILYTKVLTIDEPIDED